jgi:hypothetical protein
MGKMNSGALISAAAGPPSSELSRSRESGDPPPPPDMHRRVSQLGIQGGKRGATPAPGPPPPGVRGAPVQHRAPIRQDKARQDCQLINRLDTALHITVLRHGLYVGAIPIWLLRGGGGAGAVAAKAEPKQGRQNSDVSTSTAQLPVSAWTLRGCLIGEGQLNTELTPFTPGCGLFCLFLPDNQSNQHASQNVFGSK